MTENVNKAHHPEKEPESRVITPEEAEEIKHATTVMKNFATAEKLFRQFPPTNVNVKEATGHFISSLAIFFNKFHKPLNLTVSQSKFTFNKQAVYQNDDKGKSLSFRLYIDGVRGMSLAPGAEEQEARQLMDVYFELAHADPLEDDFVSLFWEKDFKLINLSTVDVFRDIMTDESASADVTVENRDLQFSVEAADMLGNSFSAEVSRLGHREQQKNRERSAEERELIKARADIFKLSEDEKMDTQKMLEEEAKYDSIYDFIDLAFTLFSLDRDPELIPAIVEVIGNSIRGFVKRYRFGEAYSLLKKVREFAADPAAALDPLQKESVRKMILGLAGEDFRSFLDQFIHNADAAEVNKAFLYISGLESSILPDIFDLIKDDTYSDAVVKLFANIGKEQFEFFQNRLGEVGPEAAGRLLDVLGMISMDRTMPLIIQRMTDPDEKVRKKCIQMLMNFDSPEVKDVFKNAITDPNETHQHIALRYYNKHAYPDIFPLLAGIFQGRDFMDERPEKQQLILGAMVRSDTDRSFKLIREVLQRRPFLGRSRTQRFQKEVIRTLSGMKSLHVADLLLRLFGEGNLPGELNDQCKSAIAAIRVRTTNE